MQLYQMLLIPFISAIAMYKAYYFHNVVIQTVNMMKGTMLMWLSWQNWLSVLSLSNFKSTFVYWNIFLSDNNKDSEFKQQCWEIAYVALCDRRHHTRL